MGKLNKKVGKRVRELREDKEMSQDALAIKAKTNQCEISRLETGKYSPSIEYLSRIAKALGVKLSELVEA